MLADNITLSSSSLSSSSTAAAASPWQDCLDLLDDEEGKDDPSLSFPSPSPPPVIDLLSSSAAASVDNSSVGQPPLAAELTDISVHEFKSYEGLQCFFRTYGRRHGFEPRWDCAGRPGGTSHSGSVECWCRSAPPATNSLKAINISMRRHRQERLEVRGQLKCRCPWRVCFNRTGEKEESWTWQVTKKRSLAHNHVLQPIGPTTVTSLLQVPSGAKDLLSALVRCGVQGESVLRRVAEEQLHTQFDASVFHNLLNGVRQSHGVSLGGEGEFKLLLLWLAQQVEDRKGSRALQYVIGAAVERSPLHVT